MHSLALYAQITNARHTQALNILAGMTGTQPRETYTYIRIVAPLRPVSDTNQISKKIPPGAQQQQQQLSYMQLEADVTSSDFGAAAGSDRPLDLQYQIITQDTPEPEIKNLILRRTTVEPQPLAAATTSARFSDEAKFKPVTSFVQEGHLFVHNDTVLRLRRVLCLPPSVDPGFEGPLPPLESLVLLDASGGWTLEASVRIDDRGKPALVRAATDQLLALQRELKGSVDLKVPERLSMDTRVRV